MTSIPKGYKQTEIGIIPNDWEVKKLGDVADKKRKWTFTGGPFGSNLKSSDYTLQGIRIIQLQNIGDGIFWDDYKIFTSESKADELLSCNIYPGEIILSKMGDPVARACIIPKYNKRYLMCSDGIRLAINEEENNNLFIFNIINHSTFRTLADNASTGSTRKRIGLNDLRNIPLPLPPLPEQTAIAEALSDTDELLTTLEKLIEKKKLIKKGTMQELLTGKKRLPGFEKKRGYRQTEVGLMPEDWDVKKLGEVCQIIGRIGFRGYTIKDIVKEGDGVITLSPSNILENKLILKERKYISFYKYDESPEIKIFDNDILLVKTGSTVGKTAIVKNLKEKATINPQLVVLKNIAINNLFLGYLIGFEFVQKQIVTAYVGGTIPTLSQNYISKFYIPLPSLPEQTAIAEAISDMDSEIEMLEKKLEKTKHIKQGMMQELLTGKTRLV